MPWLRWTLAALLLFAVSGAAALPGRDGALGQSPSVVMHIGGLSSDAPAAADPPVDECKPMGEFAEPGGYTIESANGAAFGRGGVFDADYVSAFVRIPGAERVELIATVRDPAGADRVYRTELAPSLPETSRGHIWGGLAVAPRGEFSDHPVEIYVCAESGETPVAVSVQPVDLDAGTYLVDPSTTAKNTTITIMSAPGASVIEAAYGIYRPNGGEELVASVTLETGLDLAQPPQAYASPSRPGFTVRAGPEVDTLQAVAFPNDRTGFVVRAISPSAVWDPNLEFEFTNSTLAGSFDAPVNVYAYDARYFVLIFPNAALAPGTTAEDFAVELTGGSPISQAPRAAHLNASWVTHMYTVGGDSNADWGLYAHVCNPLGETVQLTDDALGVQGWGPRWELRSLLPGTFTETLNANECGLFNWEGEVSLNFSASLDYHVGPDPADSGAFSQWWTGLAIDWYVEESPAVRN
jgi:hypothetical protein